MSRDSGAVRAAEEPGEPPRCHPAPFHKRPCIYRPPPVVKYGLRSPTGWAANLRSPHGARAASVVGFTRNDIPAIREPRVAAVLREAGYWRTEWVHAGGRDDPERDEWARMASDDEAEERDPDWEPPEILTRLPNKDRAYIEFKGRLRELVEARDCAVLSDPAVLSVLYDRLGEVLKM
jgi:hypothetical protein